jgi:hypothetical protein
MNMRKKDAYISYELGIYEGTVRSILYYTFKSIMKNLTLDLEWQKLKRNGEQQMILNISNFMKHEAKIGTSIPLSTVHTILQKYCWFQHNYYCRQQFYLYNLKIERYPPPLHLPSHSDADTSVSGVKWTLKYYSNHS